MGFDNPITPEEVRPIKLSTKILPIKDINNIFGLDVISGILQERVEQFAKASEKARVAGENRVRFWNMLVSNIADVAYKPPQDRQSQVLDLACGSCKEGVVLSAFFGGNDFGYPSDRVKVTGVDINNQDIEWAIKDHQKYDFSKPVTTYYLPSNFEFIVGDATDLNKYPQIPQKADVVVIRHQQISDNEQIWTKIFGQTLKRVSPEGIVLITSYSDIEHKLALEALRKLPCEVVVNQQNPYAKPLDREISVDCNIAIVKRK